MDEKKMTTHARSADGFQNFLTRTGIGADSQADGGTYGLNPITRNRQLLEWVYRGSWIVQKAVNSYADDMVREGIDIRGDIAPDAIEKIYSLFRELGLWAGLSDAIKWSRLYGGALAVLMIDGQDMRSPLRLDSVGKGQFKGILALDRWTAIPRLHDFITDYGPDFGKPKYYDIIGDAMGLPTMKIHHSRVIRLEGIKLPRLQAISELGWGMSMLEPMWDRLLAFDSATNGAAQLIYKAHYRVFSVEGLRDILAMGGDAEKALVKNMDYIRKFQNSEGLTTIDAADTLESQSYSFAGLSDMMLQFGQQLSGSMGEPLVKLFGQSPAGLNATGESDMRMYEDSIKQNQEKTMHSGMGRIIDLSYRSLFGSAPPESIGFEFRSLRQSTPEQKADIAAKITDTVVKASDAGLIDRHTALKELRQSSQHTGQWTNVTDEEIEAAENEPPPFLTEEPQPQDAQAPDETKPI